MSVFIFSGKLCISRLNLTYSFNFVHLASWSYIFDISVVMPPIIYASRKAPRIKTKMQKMYYDMFDGIISFPVTNNIE